MTSSSEFVVSGQAWRPPKASLQNAWTEAAIRSQSQRTSRSHGGFRTRSVDISVIAGLGGITPRSVVGIGVPVIEPQTGRPTNDNSLLAFGAIAPQPGRWGIAEEGGVANQLVRTTVVGLTWAQVNVQSLSDRRVDWVATELRSGFQGPAELIWPNDATGVQWCVILLHRQETQERTFWGTADENITVGGVGDVIPGIGSGEPGFPAVSCQLTIEIGGRATITAGRGVLYVRRVDGTRMITQAQDEP